MTLETDLILLTFSIITVTTTTTSNKINIAYITFIAYVNKYIINKYLYKK